MGKKMFYLIENLLYLSDNNVLTTFRYVLEGCDD